MKARPVPLRRTRGFRVRFEKAIRALLTYARAHGNADVPFHYATSGVRLDQWVARRRGEYVKGRLPRSEVRALEAISGWRWRGSRRPTFSARLRSLRAFIKAHGHSDVPVKYRDPDNRSKLGAWVSGRRRLYRLGRLPRQQVKALAGVRGWEWRTDRRHQSFDEVLQALRTYADAHGHADVPARYRQARTGFPLGRWVVIRRKRYRYGVMPEREAKALERLPGWAWEGGTQRPVYELLKRLSVYAKKHGHTRVSTAEPGLGPRVRWARREYLRQFTTEQIRAFEALPGWSWVRVATADRFMTGLEHLRAFSKKHGHTRLPEGYRRGGLQLQMWAAKQRQYCRRGTLSPERRRLLQAIPGWSWNPRHATRGSRSDHYEALRAYIDANGHADVPANYRQPHTGYRLGLWVSLIRHRYKAGLMSKRQVKMLESVPGWSWQSGRLRHVKTLLRALSAYAQKHGHMRVPATYRTSSGYGLGAGVRYVRARYPDRLTREQIQAIEAIAGWSWSSDRTAS